MDYTFTVFTPCYNGEKTIQRVFDSMLAQTYNKWEWIIVNDGSKDRSDTVIRELLTNVTPPPIRERITYISQENIGKHRTWNKVAQIAKGDIFVPADCDDSFVPETLAFFNEALNKEKDIEHLSGINVCCYDPETEKIIGTPYPHDGLLSDNIELDLRYHVRGEHWGCIRTDLIKKYPFPEVKGHYFSEGYLWYSFPRDGYKVRCYNKCLRAYFYEEQSLIHNKSYKLDYNTCIMQLQHSVWKLTNVGHLIRKYSLKDYIKLCLSIPKQALKVCLAKLTNHT